MYLARPAISLSTIVGRSIILLPHFHIQAYCPKVATFRAVFYYALISSMSKFPDKV